MFCDIAAKMKSGSKPYRKTLNYGKTGKQVVKKQTQSHNYKKKSMKRHAKQLIIVKAAFENRQIGCWVIQAISLRIDL